MYVSRFSTPTKSPGLFRLYSRRHVGPCMQAGRITLADYMGTVFLTFVYIYLQLHMCTLVQDLSFEMLYDQNIVARKACSLAIVQCGCVGVIVISTPNPLSSCFASL
jgi:TctA family transporter